MLVLLNNVIFSILCKCIWYWIGELTEVKMVISLNTGTI